MIRNAALPLLLLAAAQSGAQGQSWEIKGRVFVREFGYPAAVVSIPALRVGTIADDLGNFVIRAEGAQQCYELLIRTRAAMVRILRFVAPEHGQLDLGNITLGRSLSRQEREEERRPEQFLPAPDQPPPERRDTVGTCRPSEKNPAESWPTAHARVVGHLTRGGMPLRGGTLDFSCGYNEPYFSMRRQTDSVGAFLFDAVLSFPQEQALADSSQAECHLRHARVSLDSAVSRLVTFGPAAAPAPITTLDWQLPDPSFRPVRVVGQVRGVGEALVIPGIAAFRPGVLPAPQAVSLELLPLPEGIVVRPYSHRAAPAQLLPVAVRVATGRKVPSTGSSIYLELPRRFAEAMQAGGSIRGFLKVSRPGETAQSEYREIEAGYDRSLHYVLIDLLPRDFTDREGPEHWIEALIVFSISH
ncbi:MAG TPA: hypothetical protein VGQ69_09010 [Gemmatimonadales bacterium]|jgi:hypothetical protein|nr:hypothetical protein [Gemmatimonadales bacterium]